MAVHIEHDGEWIIIEDTEVPDASVRCAQDYETSHWVCDLVTPENRSRIMITAAESPVEQAADLFGAFTEGYRDGLKDLARKAKDADC